MRRRVQFRAVLVLLSATISANLARFVVQPQANWNLARISNRGVNFLSYVYDERAGEGVTVFVLDTGLDIHHNGERLLQMVIQLQRFSFV